MDRAVKSRKSVRGAVTKTCREIEAELSTQVPHKPTLEDLLAKLKRIEVTLKEKDEAVEEAMLDEDKPDAELEKEFEEAEAIIGKIYKIEQKVKYAISSQIVPSDGGSVGGSAKSGAHEKKSFKLPKIELSKFNGDLKGWLGWWSQFEKIHNDKTIDKSDKFQYLLQATEEKSEPREMISVFPATADNYDAAVDTLKRRYGREGLQLQVYLRELLHLVIANVTHKEKIPLNKLYLKLESHLRALQTLDLSKAEPSMYFYPLVESSLPEETLRTWLRSAAAENGTTKKDRLEDLMEFIKKEVEGEQQISLAQNAFQDKKSNARTVGQRPKKEETSTAASLYTGSSNECAFCKKTYHRTLDCLAGRKMTHDEKKRKLQESRSCFVCLNKGHAAKNCKAKPVCFICNGRHQTIMCNRGLLSTEAEGVEQAQAQSGSNAVQTPANPTPILVSVHQSRLVLLKTLRVRVKGTNGKEKECRLLFDDGSQYSYIKTELVEELACKKLSSFKLQNSLFGGVVTPVKNRGAYRVHVRGADELFTKKKELILVNDHTIASACPVIPPGPWMEDLARQNIHVTDFESESTDVDILIGSDWWGDCMTGREVKLRSGLTAYETKFGWTVSGAVRNRFEDNYASLVTTSTIVDDKSLATLWSLEAIGISDSPEKISKEEEDMELKKEFQQSIRKSSDGRYIIQLPWTCSNEILPDNKAVAIRRLENATRKLQEQGEYERYSRIFQSWLDEGIIEKMDLQSERQIFLPHRPVFKPESLTTPVRPVFDASCRIGKGPSLNDCLAKGPNLLELIPSILLRFRKKRIGVISDIRKAFQMIEVNPSDREFQKFLWWEDPEKRTLAVYRHCRVVFGMNCSPFILAAVLEYHLQNVQEGDKATARELLKSLYVDNSVTSFHTEEELEKFKEEASRLIADAKMELRQWESNSLPSCSAEERPVTTVLGLKWNKQQDLLYCKLPTKLVDVQEMKITKRSVLSLVSQIYDPLGFTCPALLQPKLQIQESWALKISWDEEWDQRESARLLRWVREIESLGEIKVPRHVFGGDKVQDLQLHCFTDASQDAYAAAVFVRYIEQDKIYVHLVISKSRLAPVSKNSKRITIPRLELLGCLIGSTLTDNVKRDLDIGDIHTLYWTDSTTALAWIKRDADWGTFVGNRVRTIRKNTRGDQWRHVPGILNPADLPSRGCSPSELLESRWWEGPEWLKETEEMWPQLKASNNEEEIASELRKTAVVCNVAQELPQPRFSSYLKNLRVAAWVRRFVTNCRLSKDERKKKSWISAPELHVAERDILLQIQRRHFGPDVKLKKLHVNKGDDGLLRLSTRLTFMDISTDFKKPIVLPKNDPLVLQLIEYVHKIYCHAGAQFVLNKLREKYWILQGRRAVSSVINKCVVCRRYSAQSYQSDPAPLPLHRVETQFAFQTTGVDLAGPVMLKGGKKCWIVIYTCAVYRAVYLDQVDSLSTEDFLDSLERFTYIIGRPSTICSDNGTNFVGAANLMKKLDWLKLEKVLHVQKIEWKFNPPTAAWWGGWWERLIRTIKDLLRKMISTAKLTKKGLQSCLASVSFVINNRPLTTLNEDSGDLIPLTPSMFIKDLPIEGLPERHLITTKDLQESYKKIRDLKIALKERFRKEYLSQLVQRSNERPTIAPAVNQVVLVGSDNKKRAEWPIGRIIELFPGKDGRIRVAKVKTATGLWTRPIQRLYPLEVPDPLTVDTPDETPVKVDSQEEIDENIVVKTRSGREVKKPQRYGSWNQ